MLPTASGQRADRTDRLADPCRQPPKRPSVDATQRRHRQLRRPGHARPADRAENRRSRVACGGKHRRQEGEDGARPSGTSKVCRPVGRTGDETMAALQVTGPHRTRPTPRAEMHARAERSRQSGIAGHHKGKPTRPADAGQVPPQRRPSRLAIVPQHDAGQAARQAGRCGARIRQPARVGEQPELRQAASGAGPCGNRTRPCEQTRMAVTPGHDAGANSW
jgi:hypothetical protein